MNPRLFLPALLAASLASAQPAAPDAAPAKPDSAPAAPAEAKTEMQKWIEATDGQWQAAFKRDVADVREAEAKKLMLQYLNLLEDAIGKASKAGDLDGAVALRNEQKRFGDTQLFPGQDVAADPAAVKQVRAAIRAQLAKLETDTALRAKALHAKYDQILAQAQTQFTQRQRLDDALLVKAKRDEVIAAWITPANAGAASTGSPAPVTTPVPTVPKPPTPKVPFGTKAGPVMAKVEAKDSKMAPFATGGTFAGSKTIQFTEIPPSFEGFQFSQDTARNATLSFKVLSDGLVYIGCTSRFGKSGNNAGNWKDEAVTDEQLHQKGWHKMKDVEFKDTQADHVWWVYSRTCRAGESFTYRTEKYIAPILLVK